MAIQIVDIILLIFLLVSLPLYITFLGMLIRFRNKRPLSSSFFTICFMLGISDLVTLTNSWLLFKMPMLGWLGTDWLIRQAPVTIGKVATMTSWWAAIGQFHGIFLMALNRLTSMAFPLRHHFVSIKHAEIRPQPNHFLADMVKNADYHCWCNLVYH